MVCGTYSCSYNCQGHAQGKVCCSLLTLTSIFGRVAIAALNLLFLHVQASVLSNFMFYVLIGEVKHQLACQHSTTIAD